MATGSGAAPALTTQARRLWTVAGLLLLLPTVASAFVGETYDLSTALIAAMAIPPLLLAVVWSAQAVGGRRGLLTALVLLALLVHWSWWFGWGADDNISPISFYGAALGLLDAAEYHAGLLWNLWPLVLLAAAVVARLARRRGRRAWSALGLLALVLVVAAFPSRAGWSDGCNAHGGSSPLITRPFAGLLMDHGIGVIPNASATKKACLGDDQSWKPF